MMFDINTNFNFSISGPLRSDLRSAHDDGREATHQYKARDHQTEHGQTDPGLWAALPQGTDAQGRPTSGI